MEQETDREALDGLLGKTITSWHLGEGGMHFTLDDKQVVVVMGLAIMQPEEDPCLH